MIECDIHVDRAGRVTGYSVEGHAGHAEKGSDIVCAAVSVLAQAILTGLEKVAGLKPDVVVREGFLECHLAPGTEEDRSGQVLLETLQAGLRQIERDYPGRVRVRTVPGQND